MFCKYILEVLKSLYSCGGHWAGNIWEMEGIWWYTLIVSSLCNKARFLHTPRSLRRTDFIEKRAKRVSLDCNVYGVESKGPWTSDIKCFRKKLIRWMVQGFCKGFNSQTLIRVGKVCQSMVSVRSNVLKEANYIIITTTINVFRTILFSEWVAFFGTELVYIRPAQGPFWSSKVICII